MTDNDLKTLLADYAAPAADNGFSDSVLRTLQSETAEIDLSDYAVRPKAPWRSWVYALTLGLIFGLLWTWIGVKMPDLPLALDQISLFNNGWGTYLIAALCMALGLIFVELESA